MKKRLTFVIFAVFIFLTIKRSVAAVFFDNVKVNSGNLFSSGTLNLTIDGVNDNVVKFQVPDMRLGETASGIYTLANVGSLDGFLSIDSVQVYDYENGCEEDEVNTGDITCDDLGLGQGEFDDLVNAQFFLDYNCNKELDFEDKVFYNGIVSGLAEKYDLNHILKAGSTVCIGAFFDWLQSKNYDLAQGDSFTFDLRFKLAQVETVSLLQNESLEITWDSEPLFSLENIVPGDVVSKKVSIKNTLAKETKVYLFAEHKSGSESALSSVLTTKIDCNNNEVFHSILSNLFSFFGSENALLLGSISSEGTLLCNLQISFDKNADNNYQGLTQNCDFSLGFISKAEDVQKSEPQAQNEKTSDEEIKGEESGQKVEQGIVLGSVEALPQTGIYPSPLPFILLVIGLGLRVLQSPYRGWCGARDGD